MFTKVTERFAGRSSAPKIRHCSRRNDTARWQHRMVSGHRSPPSCHRVPHVRPFCLSCHRVEFFVREKAIFFELREKFDASLIVITTAWDYADTRNRWNSRVKSEKWKSNKIFYKCIIKIFLILFFLFISTASMLIERSNKKKIYSCKSINISCLEWLMSTGIRVV